MESKCSKKQKVKLEECCDVEVKEKMFKKGGNG